MSTTPLLGNPAGRRRGDAASNRADREHAGRYRQVLRALERKSAALSAQLDGNLARLQRAFDRVREMDFFDASGRAEVERLQEAMAMRRRPPETRKQRLKPTLDVRALRGRRWVTRPRPHVDRVASAWLIRRFIDPEARFEFADAREQAADAISFDTPGAELSHDGDDCTFETLIKRAGLRDRRLTRLAEIVHEADLRDGKFPRDEARGIDLAIRGLLASQADDHQVLAHGIALFEGLYAGANAKD